MKDIFSFFSPDHISKFCDCPYQEISASAVTTVTPISIHLIYIDISINLVSIDLVYVSIYLISIC